MSYLKTYVSTPEGMPGTYYIPADLKCGGVAIPIEQFNGDLYVLVRASSEARIQTCLCNTKGMPTLVLMDYKHVPAQEYQLSIRRVVEDVLYALVWQPGFSDEMYPIQVVYSDNQPYLNVPFCQQGIPLQLQGSRPRLASSLGNQLWSSAAQSPFITKLTQSIVNQSQTYQLSDAGLEDYPQQTCASAFDFGSCDYSLLFKKDGDCYTLHSDWVLTGETSGGRCFQSDLKLASSTVHAATNRCFQVLCGSGSYQLRIGGNNYACSDSLVVPGYEGAIQCWEFSEVCPLRKGLCMGQCNKKGMCLNGACRCIGGWKGQWCQQQSDDSLAGCSLVDGDGKCSQAADGYYVVDGFVQECMFQCKKCLDAFSCSECKDGLSGQFCGCSDANKVIKRGDTTCTLTSQDGCINVYQTAQNSYICVDYCLPNCKACTASNYND